jgi:glycerophosphoryl diester phosphodiesterase
VPHPYLDNDGPLAFAHRGGASVHPENTERAFRHAVEIGFTHVETDVHVTRDGVAVAFHDDVLDRVTDQKGVVAELDWAEVRRAKVDGSDEICRLDDLLAGFPDTRFNLDPKHDAAIKPLAEVLRRTNTVERVCVTSFSRRRTRRVKADVGPRLCTGAGPVQVVANLGAGWHIPVSIRGVEAFQVPVRVGRVAVVTRRFVEAAHRRQLHVHVWTIDDAVEISRLLDLGVDGVMTDEPEVLRSVYLARGHWPG